jgi:alanine-glyoxylate transaminase/serine-glyoxylate transaminase/serine-pyruvate transaminase
MSHARALLMIPGPVEISPAVQQAFDGPPPGHLSTELIGSFGAALEAMRRVWRAGPSHQAFVVGGGGTVAMDMAVANLVEPGDRVVVANSGYFSDRLAEMLRRREAEVDEVRADVGDSPRVEAVAGALDRGRPARALFATHVDTSTGVLVDPQPLCRLARERGALSVFDGVCSTAGEPFEMERWGADVFLTASQKAVGLPPGLALMVASPRALETRAARRSPAPPMVLDWEQWLPVMRAYEERRPSYFSTPPTNLVRALEIGLREILEPGLEARLAAHRRAALALRGAWRAFGLDPVPARDEVTAHTMSALRFPRGVDASLVQAILRRGVVVAGGLHPAIRASYFRVGHMGHVVTRPDLLRATVEAIGEALGEAGRPVDVAAAAVELSRALPS